MSSRKKMGVDVAEDDEDSFFEHRNTSMFMTWVLSTSVTKKKLFYVLSVLLCLFQTAMLIADVMFHFHIKNHSFPSHRHTEAILILQVVTFYWSALATTYSLQAGNRKMGYLSLASVCFNVTVFASRFGYEFMMMQFREEKY